MVQKTVVVFMAVAAVCLLVLLCFDSYTVTTQQPQPSKPQEPSVKEATVHVSEPPFRQSVIYKPPKIIHSNSAISWSFLVVLVFIIVVLVGMLLWYITTQWLDQSVHEDLEKEATKREQEAIERARVEQQLVDWRSIWIGLLLSPLLAIIGVFIILMITQRRDGLYGGSSVFLSLNGISIDNHQTAHRVCKAVVFASTPVLLITATILIVTNTVNMWIWWYMVVGAVACILAYFGVQTGRFGEGRFPMFINNHGPSRFLVPGSLLLLSMAMMVGCILFIN